MSLLRVQVRPGSPYVGKGIAVACTDTVGKRQPPDHRAGFPTVNGRLVSVVDAIAEAELLASADETTGQPFFVPVPGGGPPDLDLEALLATVRK